MGALLTERLCGRVMLMCKEENQRGPTAHVWDLDKGSAESSNPMWGVGARQWFSFQLQQHSERTQKQHPPARRARRN